MRQRIDNESTNDPLRLFLKWIVSFGEQVVGGMRPKLILLALVSICLSWFALPVTLSAQSSPDPRFGAVEAFRDPKAARDLNLGWERIIFYWAELQRNGPNDAWNVFQVEDGWLNDAASNGRQVVGLIENTPAWATDGVSGSGVPRGLYLPIDDPNNLWAGFIRTLVKRYAGRVDHWIIWNEPDIEPPADGVQFDGSVADYYQLVKVASIVAKQENSHAVIHLAGLTFYHDVANNRPPYLQRFLDEAKKDPTAAEHNDYFDVATTHIYFSSDSVYDITQFFANTLRRNGLHQPIWINETNAAPSDDPLNPWSKPLFVTSLEQQAAFVPQAFAIGLAAGAERLSIYKLMDFPAYPPGFPAFGLIRADNTHRPAYAALKVVTTYFRDTRQARLIRTGSMELVTLDRGSQSTRVAWARGPSTTTISLPAFAPEAQLVALDGTTQAITAVNGAYQIMLPAATCNDPSRICAIGGIPIILVENAPAKLNAGPINPDTATPRSTSTPTVKPPTATRPAATSTLRPSQTPSPTQPAPSQPPATSIVIPTATSTIEPISASMPQLPPAAAGSSSLIGLIVLGLGIELVLVIIALRLGIPRRS